MPVNQNLLDPTVSVREGDSDRLQRFPVKGMTQIDIQSRHSLFDGLWRWQDMVWPEDPVPWDTHLNSNVDRRIPVLWALPTVQDPALERAYLQAVSNAYYYSPFAPQPPPPMPPLSVFAPLDQDDEFIKYAMRFGWGGGAPDYYPIVEQFCTTDTADARQQVDQLLGAIKNVPRAMTQGQIGLYQRVIRELQAQIDAVPPPPLDQIAAMQAEINGLQQKIDSLQQFLKTLQ